MHDFTYRIFILKKILIFEVINSLILINCKLNIPHIMNKYCKKKTC